MGKKQYFVTGIGTDVGKTWVSAILVEALKADYWKPIQAGDLHYSDTDKVKALVSNHQSKFHANAYAFKAAASPHYAASLEELTIEIENIIKPKVENSLIVEGAGGLLVPLNDQHLIIDLIQHLNLEVILVIRNYLGSINHSLLSVEALKQRHISIKGIIFNGEVNAASEDYILKYTKLSFLGRIFEEEELTKKRVKHYAKQFEFLAND